MCVCVCVATQVTGDLRDADAVEAVCKGADCVWHNAAAVGPFHPQELYMQVSSRGVSGDLLSAILHYFMFIYTVRLSMYE